MQNAYLHVIVLLHAGFAGALLLLHSQQPSRFVRRFAWSWAIEAVRAAILLPQVHTLGGRAGEWYCLADVLCFFSNWFLFSACADLVGARLPRWLAPVYFGASIPLVLLEIVGLKGARRWLETHAVPLRDAAGRVTALPGVTRDITESQRAGANDYLLQDRLNRMDRLGTAVARELGNRRERHARKQARDTGSGTHPCDRANERRSGPMQRGGRESRSRLAQ